MKDSQRGFVAPLLIAITVLILGAISYFYTNGKSTPLTEPLVGIETKLDTIEVAVSPITTTPSFETTVASEKNASSTTHPVADEILAAKSATVSDIYIKYNNNYYSRVDGTYNFTKVEGADLESFQIIPSGHGYAKDKNYIYYYGRQTELNPKTTTFLGDFWIKDDANVYFNNEKIVGADAATFIALGEKYSYVRFAKDKNTVFFQQNQIVMIAKELPKPDAKSFVFMGAYAKDATRVFYLLDYNINSSKIGVSVIDGADPETFRELHSRSGQNMSYSIAKDKSHVYYFDKILQNISDIDTFEYVAGPLCYEYGDGFTCNYITKDKQCIYLNNERVLGEDGLCINPTQCTVATTNTSCGIK